MNQFFFNTIHIVKYIFTPESSEIESFVLRKGWFIETVKFLVWYVIAIAVGFCLSFLK